MPKVGFDISAFVGLVSGRPDPRILHAEVVASTIDALFDGIVEEGSTWFFIFGEALTAGEEIVLNRIVGQHGGLSETSFVAEAFDAQNTSSLTDVLVPNMTLTPPAGTYLVWFSAAVGNGTASNSVTLSIYFAGTRVAASERVYARGANRIQTGLTCIAKVKVNGAQAIEGQWKVSGGVGSLAGRTLVAVATDGSRGSFTIPGGGVR